jgi:hypothetical protein
VLCRSSAASFGDRFGWEIVRGNKKAARGRLDEHVGDHVLYEMMMMPAARCVFSEVIVVYSIAPHRERQRRGPDRVPSAAGTGLAWGHLCVRTVNSVCMIDGILGIDEKFRG